MAEPEFHKAWIGGEQIALPLMTVGDGVRVAVFDLSGNWKLAEIIGVELARRIPDEVEALIMPEGKATALLHVVGRELDLPTVIARKSQKPYMTEPVVSVSYRSITTQGQQSLCIGAEEVAKLSGKRVAFLDDVVSTGGSLDATRRLLRMCTIDLSAVAAAFTEGDPRDDVIALDHLPVFT